MLSLRTVSWVSHAARARLCASSPSARASSLRSASVRCIVPFATARSLVFLSPTTLRTTSAPIIQSHAAASHSHTPIPPHHHQRQTRRNMADKANQSNTEKAPTEGNTAHAPIEGMGASHLGGVVVPPGLPVSPLVHPNFYRHLSEELLAALNPHSHITTSVRIRNIMIALIGCFAISALGVYIFRDNLKANLSEQTADVATRSLSSAEVQSQVNLLSAEIVRKLLNDPVIMENCLGFLQTLFASAETKASLVTLLQGTLQDPATLTMLSSFASDLLTELMNKPETLDQLTALLRRAISEPGNEKALQVLFKNFIDDKKTQQLIAELAKQAALDVLNDPSVKSTAVDFVKSVTSDTSLQQSTGDAMWEAVKHAVRPNWLTRHSHVTVVDSTRDERNAAAPAAITITHTSTEPTDPNTAADIAIDQPHTDPQEGTPALGESLTPNDANSNGVRSEVLRTETITILPASSTTRSTTPNTPAADA